MYSDERLVSAVVKRAAVYGDQAFRKFVGVNPVRRRNADEK
jgi:hypothetical protein